ncbi:MAG TPA: UTRA domain-containing protein [Candidatus Blautia gallistercoris]|uniref:UTRA domain-containing protein n=1 Tax=Candidatus Blautia gallistercoris TaxID=2838490 RepID=A0A9D1WFU5_9FIRM|nr:UTRA domain-containing protein [Candidatus Blautia gallistercoris]
MPKSKYERIYKDMKKKIEADEFSYQDLLPSENTLIQTYDCSRNTVRRAIGMLVTDGYVQTLPGKGVRNIYRPIEQTSFTIGEIETFRESALRNHQSSMTKVLVFTEITANEKLSRRTGFPLNAELYYIQRLHYLDGKPLILNHNYFLKSVTPGLTVEIAQDSIYRYLENTLHMTIVNSKRFMTVEKITEVDEKYMDLNVEDYNCVAVVTSYTYNSDGIMFEYTQSRHRPDYFRFQDNAVRRQNF